MRQTNRESHVETVADLGRFVREHRKSRRLTLETVAGLANVGLRFLSEFERGKKTAEVGKVLKTLTVLGLEVIVRPRRTGSARR
jgi:transcriptional regulator with XRE-family HTH domain